MQFENLPYVLINKIHNIAQNNNLVDALSSTKIRKNQWLEIPNLSYSILKELPLFEFIIPKSQIKNKKVKRRDFTFTSSIVIPTLKIPEGISNKDLKQLLDYKIVKLQPQSWKVEDIHCYKRPRKSGKLRITIIFEIPEWFCIFFKKIEEYIHREYRYLIGDNCNDINHSVTITKYSHHFLKRYSHPSREYGGDIREHLEVGTTVKLESYVINEKVYKIEIEREEYVSVRSVEILGFRFCKGEFSKDNLELVTNINFK